MTNILVINSGSSSLKYKLLDMNTDEVIFKGEVERIGDKHCPDHKTAVQMAFKDLGKRKIDAIGHRVVHGGEVFKVSTIATEETLNYLDKVSHLAPLHNPANVMGIRACMELFPKIPNVMVFDTAFHNTIPQKAYLYAIPIHDYIDHGIRRYGFHGTSHNYVSRKCAELFGKPREKLKIISVHIGNGGSVCAVLHGQSVETSMGLTPLEGLVMGTRSGDIDPAAIQYLSQAHKFTIDKTINYLNKDCGLKALAGLGTSDMRDLIANIDKHDVQGAIDVYCHRITKYIGSYIAVLNGVDAIAWAGGVGTNMPLIREKVMVNFEYIGAYIDPQINAIFYNNYKTGEITANGDKPAHVRTFVINTNEELEIAMETVNLLGKN